MATGTRKSIGSVQRAIDILNLFDARTIELGITEIAAAQNLHKSTTAGLVYTLEQNGYLEQNPRNRKYRLGLRLLERAFTALDQIDVRERALPFLEDLRNWCDESVNLAVRSGGHMVYIHRLEGSHELGMHTKVGRRAPIHATALGKAMLACMPLAQIERLVSRFGLPPVTDKTITSLPLLLDELARAREQGYAIDDQENDLGGRCVAAPILNCYRHPVAAVSVSAPLSRFPLDQVPQVGEKVRQVAQEISRQLGYRPAPSKEAGAAIADGQAATRVDQTPAVSSPDGAIRSV